METAIEILVICTNNSILETILRLLNTNESWRATGTSSPDDALIKCREVKYQVFLVGAGLSDAEESGLKIQIKDIHPDIHIVPHYGGGSGLLFAEIYLALGKQNQAQ
jgi:PleD family two-component response regulator